MAFTAFDTLALRAMIAGMSHKALRVYVLLSTYADRKGVCWPQAKELSEMSGMRVESVLEGLQELERDGLMAYLRRNERDPITGKMQNNVYFVDGPLLKADSAFDSSSKHEPIPPFELKSETTNVVTNSINQSHDNHLHTPPPLTTTRREAEKQTADASTTGNVEGKDKGQGQKQPRKNSRAATAPQNSKAPLPLPPLPRGFNAAAAMTDEDDEAAARWLCDQATTRLDGGEYRAAMTMANARRYVVRFGRWKIRAAVALVKSDPTTRALVGRMHYLLCTSVAEEAQRLEETMKLINE